MAVNTVRRPADAWVDQSRQNANIDRTGQLKLRTDGSSTQIGYVHFRRPFPLEATVRAATLRFYLANFWAGSQQITVRRITERWSVQRITYANRPNDSNANQGQVTVTDRGDRFLVEIDVTALLGDVSQGAPYFGFAIRQGGASDRRIYSAQASRAELRPTLEVEWGAYPNPPSRLAPANEQVVSVAKPVLNWRFEDNRGDTEQSASQVQISTSSSFVAPTYDSGKAANTESKWDLAATAFAGLADGDVRYWRVKVWDGLDLASDWSDIVQFSRSPKGVLTLVNPPGAGTVPEATPPVSWTFTGTQRRFEVALMRIWPNSWLGDIFPPQVLERWRGRTDNSVTVPKNTLRSGHNYRVRVRVWDNKDRAVTIGDPDFVQVTRDFTYVRDGSPNAVPSLTATQVGESPAVLLTWTRSQQPDFFSLRINGEEVEQRIDPMEVFDSGTTYKMRFWGADPLVNNTFEIEAVVNDGTGKLKHSSGNATATKRIAPRGTWLVDLDDDLAVQFLTYEQLSFGIGESASTQFPIGTRRPVRKTTGIRGYEGTAGGIIDGRGERDQFLRLKGRAARSEKLRLIVDDINVPVGLGEVTGPLPRQESDENHGYFDASFEWFQIGEFKDTLRMPT